MTVATAPARPEAISAQQTDSTRQRLAVFDILRAASAVMVFLYHYRSLTTDLTQGSAIVDALEWAIIPLGGIGVYLLLLLSGYFTGMALASRRFEYFRFVLVRTIRIYAPYIAVLLLAAGFASLLPAYSRVGGSAITVELLLRQLLLFPGLFPEEPLLTVTWTLAYIMAGYLTLPVFAMFAAPATLEPKARFRAWAALTLAIVAGLVILDSPLIRLAYFPAGCALLELQRAGGWRGERRWSMRTALIIVALMVAIRMPLRELLTGDDWTGHLRRSVYSIAGLVAVWCLGGAALILQRRHDLIAAFPPLRFVAALGRTGYSFYLIHGPVCKVFILGLFPLLAGRRASPEAYWLLMPLCWALAATSAAVLYKTIEKPSRSWGASGSI